MLGEASYKLAASRDRFGLGALPHCRPRSSSCSRLASRAGWALPVGRCPVWAMCVVLCGWRCVWAVCASPECSWAGRVVHFESIGERDPSPLSVELGSLGLGSHVLAFLLPPKRFETKLTTPKVGSMCTRVNGGARKIKGKKGRFKTSWREEKSRVDSKRLGGRRKASTFARQGTNVCFEGTGLGFKGCGSNRLFILTTPKVGSMCTRVNGGARKIKGKKRRFKTSWWEENSRVVSKRLVTEIYVL